MLKEQIFGKDGSYFVPSFDVKRKKKVESTRLSKQLDSNKTNIQFIKLMKYLVCDGGIPTTSLTNTISNLGLVPRQSC